MRGRRLIWQLFPSYLLVLAAALLAATWYTTLSMRQFYHEWIETSLESKALLVREQVSGYVARGQWQELDELADRLSGLGSTRVTVVRRSGEVVADSESDAGTMDNHANRPELVQAFNQRSGSADRFSATLQKKMKYVAVPIEENGEVVAAVRCALPMTSLDEAFGALYGHIAFGGIVVALLATALSLGISRRITRPIEEMRHGAERFAQGDLSHTLAVPPSQELGGLAEAMNQMAGQLDDRIRTVIQQHNELNAVISSMAEGVLAVDAEGCVLSMNTAAGRLFDTSPGQAQGKPLRVLCPDAELQRMISRASGTQESVEGEVVLRDDAGEKLLEVHATALRDAQGRGIGAVAVINDLSHLRQLEQVRRDFVANVSHEIRTPVTAIKGYVETLLDGAMQEPKDLKRFLKIILRQANRLNAIIEDLLTLARIEQENDQVQITLEENRLLPTLQAALQACETRASAKDIRVNLSCPSDLSTHMNPPIFEQAVSNLVENAIKYSEPGSEVSVSAGLLDSEIVIEVADHGCGIDKEHLPRLFERFYRVDKARSRKLGGTGLGLAIVKHIAQAHGGTVHVESEPGNGSVFSLHVPRT